mmetsp:Transcript_8534/g.25641  ORF Transcript_8534/g.25641 Transcript_8534/m.25641 type:complete len:255 (-) Transcript_8534:1504-2268(-)
MMSRVASGEFLANLCMKSPHVVCSASISMPEISRRAIHVLAAAPDRMLSQTRPESAALGAADRCSTAAFNAVIAVSTTAGADLRCAVTSACPNFLCDLALSALSAVCGWPVRSNFIMLIKADQSSSFLSSAGTSSSDLSPTACARCNSSSLEQSASCGSAYLQIRFSTATQSARCLPFATASLDSTASVAAASDSTGVRYVGAIRASAETMPAPTLGETASACTPHFRIKLRSTSTSWRRARKSPCTACRGSPT